MLEQKMGDIKFTHALVAGAAAGFTADMSSFPLDTLKTRLQSAEGFARSGRFRGVYCGVLSSAVGSVPTAVAFFCTYELVKKVAGDAAYVHALAASLGEVASCTIRVPVEVVKQRAQATRTSSSANFCTTLKSEGPMGFYRGFWSTVWRDVPFSFIQLPLWELLKKYVGKGDEVSPQQSAICGAVSGCAAASITNPLDVAKTRIMLASKDTCLARGSISSAMRVVYQEKGLIGLSAGITPNMVWMSMSGFIFLGTYDLVKDLMKDR